MTQVNVEPLSNVELFINSLSPDTYHHFPCITSETQVLALSNADDEVFFNMHVPVGLISEGDSFHALGWIEDDKYHYHVLGLSKSGLIGIDIDVCEFTKNQDSPTQLTVFQSSKIGMQKLCV